MTQSTHSHRIGSAVFDSRTRERGVFCGWTKQGLGKIRRDGKLLFVKREFVKRFNSGLWTR